MSRNLRLQLIMDAAGNATRFLKGVKGETDATSKSLRAARERVSELQRASRDVAGYRSSQDQLQKVREKLVTARAEMRRLGVAMDATEKPTKQMARAFELAKTKLNELSQKEQGQIRHLAELDAKLKGAGISTKALGAHEVRLARDLKAANTALDAQSEKMRTLEARQKRITAARGAYDKRQAFAGTAAGAGASAIGAGVAAAAPLVAVGKAAVNFQDAMLDVKKVVDFDTPEQFAQMNRDVLQLSTDLGLPAEGVAKIIAAAGQAKIARGELKGFALDAGQMGVAFGTTAEDAGAKMATWRTAFGMSQDSVRAFADQINYLGDNGNATALAISDVVTRVGPLGGVAGAAAAEVAALGATVVGFGVAEEVAATGIKNTLLALTKGEAATKAQRKAYAALGLEAENVAKAMQMDAGGTILDVLERVKKLSPDRQASILTQLFGSESVGAIAPMLSQLDVLRTNLDAVADSQKTAGSMAKEFENRMSGAKGAMDRAKEGLRNAAIAAGSEFLPDIKAAAEAVKVMAGRLSSFAQAHPGVIRAVGILLGVVAAALLVFGGLALAVAAVLGPFALLQFALTGAVALFTGPLVAGIGAAAGATWAFTAALLANPITWIVVGVVALAAAAFLIYRNWGPISAWWSGIWTKIKEIGGEAIRGLISIFMNFTPAGLMIQAFQKVWPALQALGPKFLEFGGQLIQGLINGVLGGVPALVRAVMSAGGKLIAGFKERLGIRSPSRVFAGLGDDTIAGLTGGLTRSAGDAVSAVSRVGAGMTAALALGSTGGPAMAFDNGPRIGTPPGAASAPSASARPSIGEVHIHINQLPGEDADALARRVADLLKQPNLSEFGDEAEGFD